MHNKVYLAGPITGTSYGECTSWRDYAKSFFDKYNVNAYSPMRGKAYLSNEDKVADSYSNFTMASINGINNRDYNDCKTSDVILVNLLDSTRVSIGTVMEIAWARAFQIPVIIVMEKENNVHDHGMLTFGHIIVPTLEEGMLATLQILLP